MMEVMVGILGSTDLPHMAEAAEAAEASGFAESSSVTTVQTEHGVRAMAVARQVARAVQGSTGEDGQMAVRVGTEARADLHTDHIHMGS